MVKKCMGNTQKVICCIKFSSAELPVSSSRQVIYLLGIHDLSQSLNHLFDGIKFCSQSPLLKPELSESVVAIYVPVLFPNNLHQVNLPVNLICYFPVEVVLVAHSP